MAGRNAVVAFLKETYGKETVLDCIKAGGFKAIFDGSIAETVLFRSPGSALVGTDYLGNRYFERMDPEVQYGRHRWVVYRELDCHRGQDPTTVPAEWHGWLHNITDDAPSQKPQAFAKHAWSLPQRGFSSNTPAAYLPKGHWSNPARRNWKKVSTWDGGQR